MSVVNLQYGAQLRENLRHILKFDDSSRTSDNRTSTDNTVSKPHVSVKHPSFLAYLKCFLAGALVKPVE